jgi:trans-aconitate methyltransferase
VTNLTFEQLHRDQPWAYGDRPDAELVEALAGVAPGPAVDIAGGQGRHALFLASRGFDVELVDLSEQALAQAMDAARSLGLTLRAVRSNLAFYEPPDGLQVAVAALAFHVPARHASMKAASRLRQSLNPGGLFYLSLPGFTADTRSLAGELLDAGGCEGVAHCHVVTREERPRLPVPRRNETRAVGFRR